MWGQIILSFSFLNYDRDWEIWLGEVGGKGMYGRGKDLLKILNCIV